MNPLSNQLDLPRLAARAEDAHKGDFGLVLVIGGSRGMAGATGLAGMAALRGGAGLVRLAVPECCLDVVASFEPSYMTVPLACDDQGRIAAVALPQILQWAESATVVACGPGLGRGEELDALVGRLYTELPRPMVLDADALNALAAHGDRLGRPGGPRILTPHPGEFARLAGWPKVAPAERAAATLELARHLGVVVVLKGHQTCVSDGREVFENGTGNPGMATGGAGDVLTGLVAALWAQGMEPLGAARLAVHLHGRAGDLAAERLGQLSLIATDLVRFLPEAIESL